LQTPSSLQSGAWLASSAEWGPAEGVGVKSEILCESGVRGWRCCVQNHAAYCVQTCVLHFGCVSSLVV
jgi:hypothetical protein